MSQPSKVLSSDGCAVCANNDHPQFRMTSTAYFCAACYTDWTTAPEAQPRPLEALEDVDEDNEDSLRAYKARAKARYAANHAAYVARRRAACG